MKKFISLIILSFLSISSFASIEIDDSLKLSCVRETSGIVNEIFDESFKIFNKFGISEVVEGQRTVSTDEANIIEICEMNSNSDLVCEYEAIDGTLYEIILDEIYTKKPLEYKGVVTNLSAVNPFKKKRNIYCQVY